MVAVIEIYEPSKEMLENLDLKKSVESVEAKSEDAE